MKNLITWLYDAFPGFADYLPPALLYLGLWAIAACFAIVIVAFVGFTLWWAITGLVGRFIFVPAMNLAIGWLEFVNRLVTGKQDFPDPVHPVIQRVVVVHPHDNHGEGEPEA